MVNIELLEDYQFLELVKSEVERRNDREFAMFNDGRTESLMLLLDLILSNYDI